ncbi:hypothetical protein [Mastigocladopsis repens]|uniref:hypothetical protein n=1 Tax=Mastigocladopsis repens TaxID=221287 RepID=UPI0002EB027D|nr:hypothetical protein [Mastigocladopsis repens]
MKKTEISSPPASLPITLKSARPSPYTLAFYENAVLYRRQTQLLILVLNNTATVSAIF